MCVSMCAYICVYTYMYIRMSYMDKNVYTYMYAHTRAFKWGGGSVTSLKYAINTINDSSVYFHFLSVTFQTASNILLQFKRPLLAFYCHRIGLI